MSRKAAQLFCALFFQRSRRLNLCPSSTSDTSNGAPNLYNYQSNMDGLLKKNNKDALKKKSKFLVIQESNKEVVTLEVLVGESTTLSVDTEQPSWNPPRWGAWP